MPTSRVEEAEAQKRRTGRHNVDAWPRARSGGVPVEAIDVAAYRIPTDFPEADGTLDWDSTTLVVVHAEAGGQRGVGYTYADSSTAVLIRDRLAAVVQGVDALSPPAAWSAMRYTIRNLGRPGIVSMAISAVDIALWDLKGKLMGQPVVNILGAVRPSVPVYGSGGFTSYPVARLKQQLAGWVADGIPRVKMKVGRDAHADRERVRAAREAVGAEAELFVDANGAHHRKEALAQAEAFAEHGVSWFEEPVSSDDLHGLRLLRDRAPAGMAIAAGEYGYDLAYFERMLEAGAVDVLQADVTRCGGITDLLRVAALCDARSMMLSTHCAPALHLHVACALPAACHLEHFHDHVRIEAMLFDGAPVPVRGQLTPDLSRPGLGLELKHADAERYRI